MLVSAVLLRKQAPALTITALVDSASVREALHDLGVQQTVSAHELVSRALAAALETPHAGEMLSALVGSGTRSPRWRLAPPSGGRSARSGASAWDWCSG